MNESKESVKIELLRLCLPTFNNNIWNLFNIKDMRNIDFEKNECYDNLSLSNEFSLGVPTNSKQIYVGQNFKSQINISNNFKSDIQLNSIFVDVLTKHNTINIYKNNEQISISSNSFFNFTSSFLVDFEDVFTVNCVAEFFHGNEKQKLRKEFNFICISPFNLKSIILHKNDKIYIEVIVKNIQDENIIINDIKFKGINCEMIKSNEITKAYSGLYYFKPLDEYSIIFCISNEEDKLKILNTKDNENITNIEILYFTSSGGKGVNNIHFLKKKLLTDKIHVYLNNSENNNFLYKLNKIYKFEIVIENNTNENICIEMFIHNNSNIHVVNNFVKAHIIEKKKKKSHFFYVLFINFGIHFFNKITIYDKKTQKKIDYINLFKVFVK
ncbi:conserved protein, unknown function [Hepatocystis sp. ex Piliocolobus tephrosceles]|nr:conserved protein, unknown function [Hepatocystis sp. ex Piliocolobus tephrosceles]